MKSLILALPLLAIGLISCSACAKKDATEPPCTGSTCPSPTASPIVPVVQSTDQVLSADNWSLSVPQAWAKMNTTPVPPEVLVFYGNQATKNLIILVKEPFAGTVSEYALEGLRGLKDGGAIVNTARQVNINGNSFVLVDSTRAGVRAWMWITAKNSFGYALSCGGPATDTTQEDTCTSVANTLKIN